MNSTQIKEKLKTLVQSLAPFAEIDVLYLFGSHAGGRPSDLSDIDLGVLLAKDVDHEKYFDYRRRLIASFAEILMSDRVDVIILNQAPCFLAFHVMAPRHILLDRNPTHRIEFEVKTANAFLDFRPFLEVRKSYVKRQIMQGDFFG